MPKNSSTIDVYLTFVNTLKKAEKTPLFKNLYITKDNKAIDITKNGQLSCAVFTTSILKMFDLIKARHATVSGAVQDMLSSGWQITDRPQVGCVLVWESKKRQKQKHKHVGFYLGKQMAISNSSQLKYPVKHHWTYGEKNNQPKRKVELILIYPDFYSLSENSKAKNNKTKPEK